MLYHECQKRRAKEVAIPISDITPTGKDIVSLWSSLTTGIQVYWRSSTIGEASEAYHHLSWVWSQIQTIPDYTEYPSYDDTLEVIQQIETDLETNILPGIDRMQW